MRTNQLSNVKFHHFLFFLVQSILLALLVQSKKIYRHIQISKVIYYFRDLNMPVYLLALYKKGEKDTLNQKEKKMMELYVAELVRAHSRRWLRIVNESSA